MSFASQKNCYTKVEDYFLLGRASFESRLCAWCVLSCPSQVGSRSRMKQQTSAGNCKGSSFWSLSPTASCSLPPPLRPCWNECSWSIAGKCHRLVSVLASLPCQAWSCGYSHWRWCSTGGWRLVAVPFLRLPISGSSLVLLTEKQVSSGQASTFMSSNLFSHSISMIAQRIRWRVPVGWVDGLKMNKIHQQWQPVVNITLQMDCLSIKTSSYFAG